MTLRYIIILITLFILGCNESQNTTNQKVYTLVEGDSNLAFEFISLKIDAIRNEQSIKDAPKNAGYAPVAYTDRRVHSQLNDQEWLEYCGSMIFKYLDYPIQNKGEYSVRIGNNPNVFIISHNKEAIRKFDELLKQWIIGNKSYLEYVNWRKKFDELQTNKENKRK